MGKVHRKISRIPPAPNEKVAEKVAEKVTVPFSGLLFPGGSLDAADVLLQAGGTGGPVAGQAGEATETLGVAQEKRQLGVGQLMPVLEEGRAQHLLCGEPRSPLGGTAGVTQIV